MYFYPEFAAGAKYFPMSGVIYYDIQKHKRPRCCCSAVQQLYTNNKWYRYHSSSIVRASYRRELIIGHLDYTQSNSIASELWRKEWAFLPPR